MVDFNKKDEVIDLSPDKEIKAYNGLKLKVSKKDADRPKSHTVQKAESRERMEKIAAKISNNNLDRNKRMFDLAQKIMSQIKDKTINKSKLASKIEDDVRKDLINLIIEIDNDENEVAGIGSTAVINLLIKLLMKSRDRINNLEFFIKETVKKQDEKIEKLNDVFIEMSGKSTSSSDR